MNASLLFLRFFFISLSILFMTIFIHAAKMANPLIKTLIGIGLGIAFGVILIGFDIFFKRFNLRTFNTTILGFFFGYLMGQALLLIFEAILDISFLTASLSIPVLELIKIYIFLFGVYIGSVLTLRSSDELYISIPFVRLTQEIQKTKNLITDISIFQDPRIIDLSLTRILDHQLIIPRFIVKELYAQAETGEDLSKKKAKHSLEVMKKLEEIPCLAIRYSETDFPEISDVSGKTIRLARLLETNILSGDSNPSHAPNIEGVAIVNINSLSNALKPLMASGELLRIKIQRIGKEPRQGVGYLEDGTMVVVNGGGDYIGNTIEGHVLSVKHTASGRMIFCNIASDNTQYTENTHDINDQP
jgi:uncharacterized protein YacL